MPITELLIAVPAYGGSVKTGCVESLLKLQAVLRKEKIPATIDFTSYAEITTVRNMFGTLMVEHPRFSHLLFIDSDMIFEPSTILRLLACDLPFVGSFCPARSIDGGVCAYVEEIVVVPEDGLVRVNSIGMGVTLIAAECFRSLHRTGKLGATSGHPFPARLSGPLISFFNAEPDGVYFSEDYAFCRRWREIGGGEVWALVRESIGHVGDHVYRRALDAKVLVPGAAVRTVGMA